MMNHACLVALAAGTVFIVMVCFNATAEDTQPAPPKPHGLVGLRPLPRTEADTKANHGGPWTGCPTYDAQKGNYPFVAEHLDVVKGWLDSDFKTKRMFLEYYWGLSEARDDLDPTRNLLVKTIKGWEERGAQIEHTLSRPDIG